MPVRILHVASFTGNIGDNANHAGFRPWFERLIGAAVEWTDFEIREVYRQSRRFDQEFANFANGFDLLVVGGGNYFELWVENSPTGTSFSITDDALSKLDVPVFFNALGVDAGQGVPHVARRRFQAFLGKILARGDLVSVRNDGSWATLQANAGSVDLTKVLRLPDAGFFAGYGSLQRPEHHPPIIGINLAGDMLETRFPNGTLGYRAFLTELAAFMTNALQRWPDLTFVMFPHIFRDLRVFVDLLEILPDNIRRGHCRVAAYDTGDRAASEIFTAYAGCDLVLGMRFHANVVPIGQGVPVAGLVCYSQVELLYQELLASDRAVDVRKPGFSQGLAALADQALETPRVAEETIEKLRDQAYRLRAEAEQPVRDWFAGRVIQH